ncbi:hypothetical protein [Stigmatella erecta]|uniref:PEGA domain-containing protein n=1 Tax=Stigmatella erecta TaxID=83460 RepID=A0A1I0H5S1_9BACT|nr:hypothetical protein [Stigmatella erecta]SET78094.1 hypothetical protein SAMN05443639_104300 [Stigmatella erecta]
MSHKPPGLLSVSSALLALIGGAAPSGLLVSGAETSGDPFRRKEEEDSHHEVLLVEPAGGPPVLLAGHRSHRSHSSHRSHYSGSGGSRRVYVPTYVPPAPSRSSTPSPPPDRSDETSTDSESTPSQRAEAPSRVPRPARVSFVAFPGGRIFVDDKPVGQDVTAPLELPAGTHAVRVENRFVGQVTVEVELLEGQTGEVMLEW